MGQIVGGYAAFGGLIDARPVVEALAASPLVDGLETPFRGGVIEVPAGAPDTWRYVVTLIPETMQRVGTDPTFGLASPDAAGRAGALDYLRTVHAAVRSAEVDVLAVELHSAPTRTADAAAFADSLAELAGWGWGRRRSSSSTATRGPTRTPSRRDSSRWPRSWTQPPGPGSACRSTGRAPSSRPVTPTPAWLTSVRPRAAGCCGG
ncbi:DUF4862 family protein [Tessaracoccus defluvii]|uniref:DUF4862 family protein n=1 Tax=Tessaracoccus defluvii TaxID=1285901 RepID=A0A7H0H4K4_9ACTN|nr:DUF4862 family protein [Tessaracoccus defluvii]